MKRFAAGFVLALLLASTATAADDKMPPLKPLKGTPTPSEPKDKDHFVFIVAGDNRPKEPTDPQGDSVKKIFKAIKDEKPAFVLWSGDTIYGKNPEDKKKIHDEYKEFLDIAADGDAAVFNAPGNHEMADHGNCPNAEMLKLYLKHTGQAAPYGSFDYGNSHFIALDSDEPDPYPDQCNCLLQPDKTKPTGYISAAQLALLSSDLAANASKKHIFIFLHRPLEGYKKEDQLCPDNVAAMQTLFKKYPTISYVIAGHQHMYYNAQGKKSDEFCSPPKRTDPSPEPYYLVSGGAGAPLKSKGFYHYVIFTVDDDKVTAKVVPLDDKDKCK
jgi:3',5'-cyclic AMP phosphodiesterase CpdA